MQWISVKDKMPTESTKENPALYIICSKEEKTVFVAFYINKEWALDKNTVFGNITHWMKLPRPPK